MNYYQKEKPYFMAKEKNNIDQNADDNAPNETSQKFDKPEKERGSRADRGTRGEIDHRHPRADEENLKQSEHYVSLKEIKEDSKNNGVTSYKPEKGANDLKGSDSKKGDNKSPTKKAPKKEKKLNDKKRPEPTPDLEGTTGETGGGSNQVRNWPPSKNKA